MPLNQLTGDLIRAPAAGTNPSRIYLELWLATRKSLIWEFNTLYWKVLDLWEQVTGQQYEKTLPEGRSDTRNRDAVREIIRTGFRGPGKYDGSVVNWLNGPLLAHIGRRRGFDVDFQRFAHRTGTNIVTMTVQVRD